MLPISPRYRRILIPVVIVILPVVLYFLFISAIISPNLTVIFRNIEPLSALALILLLYPVFRRPGWVGELSSLVLTLILFAMPLSYTWNTAWLDGNIIGGLLPWSDASGYFMDAQRLLVGENFSVFASRRPMFAGLVSVLLLVTRHNLQITLAILGLATAFSCYFLARVIRRTEGAFVSVIVLVVIFLYYRVLISRLLTEHVGLSLGALGLAFLWSGAHERKKWAMLFGIMLLALGLNARAGAFFILPMLVLWGTWFFRDRRLFSRWFLVGSVLAILSAFTLNSLLLNVIGSHEGKAFSNFSSVLYGLATGYKGWARVYQDHPGVKDQEIYRYAFDLIQSNPRGLLIGIGLAYMDFLNPGGNNAFRFMYFGGENSELIYMIVFAFAGIGLIWCLRNFRTWRGSLLIALTLGILFSVPFAPPIDSDAMRVYAVTIPVVGLLIGTGAIAPVRWLKRGESNPLITDDHTDRLHAPLAVGLVIACILGPIVIYQLGRFPNAQPPVSACQPGFEPLTVYVNHGSIIHLVNKSKIPQTHVPYVRVDEFRDRISISRYKFLVEELKKLPSGTSILVSLDYQESTKTGLENLFLVANTDQLPRDDGLESYCAQLTEKDRLKRYQFYYTQEFLKGSASPIAPFGVPPSRILSNGLYMVIVMIALILESIIFIIQEFRKNKKSERESEYIDSNS